MVFVVYSRWCLWFTGVESLESAELDSLLTSITGPIAVETQTLQKTYLSHSCLIEGGGSHTPLYSPPTDPHPLRDTYMAVHSLDLHLQAAWLRYYLHCITQFTYTLLYK